MRTETKRTFVLLVSVGSLLIASSCGSPSSIEHYEEVPTTTIPAPVDILFVIDNTRSTTEEQALLNEQGATFLQELIVPTSPNEALVDLHVGVTSMDLGMRYNITICRTNGDDALLLNSGQDEGCDALYSAEDCGRSSCPWLVHSSRYPDDGRLDSNPPLWRDFQCISALGTVGCGYDRPLEATHRALIEQGSAGGANEGFLRDDSLLLLIIVTDNDDCSFIDDELGNPMRDDYGPLATRCAMNDELLHPVSQYYDELLALRDGRENRLALGLFAGFPSDGSWNRSDPAATIRELQQLDPDDSSRLLPSCDTDMGEAYPPARLAEFAERFEENAVLASSCTSDWSSAFADIETMLRGLVERRACVTIPEGLEAHSQCRVVQRIPAEDDCPTGSEDIGLDEGRRRCVLPHSSTDPEGWFIQASSSCPEGSAINASFSWTSDVLFECSTELNIED